MVFLLYGSTQLTAPVAARLAVAPAVAEGFFFVSKSVSSSHLINKDLIGWSRYLPLIFAFGMCYTEMGYGATTFKGECQACSGCSCVRQSRSSFGVAVLLLLCCLLSAQPPVRELQ